jgi:hypothetical protein
MLTTRQGELSSCLFSWQESAAKAKPLNRPLPAVAQDAKDAEKQILL